jgi:outer membrane protein assembly factor BamB
MDFRLPQRREERLRVGTILWRRRLSEGIINPLVVADRYLVVESDGHLYAFNAATGTMADSLEYAARMNGSDSYYFSFSGLGGADVKGITAPFDAGSLKTNHIYDLARMEKIYAKDSGTAGVPLVVGRHAFFGFLSEWGDSYLIAYDLKKHRVLWEKELIGQRIILRFPPATDGEHVYFRTLSHLTAVSIKGPETTWVTKLTGKEKEEGYRDIIYFSAPVVWDHTVYLVRDEYLIPYRPRNGETNYNSWRRYLGSIGLNAVEAGAPPILMRNRLYTAGGLYFLNGSFKGVGGEHGGYSRIAAVDLAEKRTLWEADIDAINVRKMVVAGKFLVLADYRGRVICLSSRTGRVLWGLDLEGGVRVRPAVYFGKVFIGTDQGWLYCVSL